MAWAMQITFAIVGGRAQGATHKATGGGATTSGGDNQH